jgi:hypothetical protein
VARALAGGRVGGAGLQQGGGEIPSNTRAKLVSRRQSEAEETRVQFSGYYSEYSASICSTNILGEDSRTLLAAVFDDITSCSLAFDKKGSLTKNQVSKLRTHLENLGISAESKSDGAEKDILTQTQVAVIELLASNALVVLHETRANLSQINEIAETNKVLL